jgi:predicted transcriptional regulator
MSKRTVSITLEESVLARVDGLASELGVTRTAFIERALESYVPEIEEHLHALENPLTREVYGLLTSRPSLMKAISAAMLEKLSSEDIERIRERAPTFSAAAARRRKTNSPGNEK